MSRHQAKLAAIDEDLDDLGQDRLDETPAPWGWDDTADENGLILQQQEETFYPEPDDEPWYDFTPREVDE